MPWLQRSGTTRHNSWVAGWAAVPKDYKKYSKGRLAWDLPSAPQDLPTCFLPRLTTTLPRLLLPDCRQYVGGVTSSWTPPTARLSTPSPHRRR